MFLSLLLISHLSLIGGDAPAAWRSCRLAEMRIGDAFTVTTTKRVYRFTVLNPRTGHVSARASAPGRVLSPPRSLYILGATHGRSRPDEQMLVLMGAIEVGKRMELGIGSRAANARAWSLPVRSIEHGVEHGGK